MQPITSEQIVLVSRPEGVPALNNFKIVTAEIEPLQAGEFLVKNQWMSVDPYMRGRMKAGDSYVPPFQLNAPLEGGCIGEVIETNHDNFPVGSMVLGNNGWREYWKSTGDGVQKVDPEVAPVRTYLGALGMTGLTAWVGLNRIAQVRPGTTVFVSAASGAVGAIACQIAKAKGCHVIGSAGSREKVQWLLEKAKVDAVLNYKEASNLSSELHALAPQGIDTYFDNVGGDHLEAAIDAMNDFGCCIECGMISTYNLTDASPAPRNLFKVIGKRIRIQGFIVRDHAADQPEFLKEVGALIQSGKLVWQESIYEGLAQASTAFIGLFEGKNNGKALVRI